MKMAKSTVLRENFLLSGIKLGPPAAEKSSSFNGDLDFGTRSRQYGYLLRLYINKNSCLTWCLENVSSWHGREDLNIAPTTSRVILC